MIPSIIPKISQGIDRNSMEPQAEEALTKFKKPYQYDFTLLLTVIMKTITYYHLHLKSFVHNESLVISS